MFFGERNPKHDMVQKIDLPIFGRIAIIRD